MVERSNFDPLLVLSLFLDLGRDLTRMVGLSGVLAPSRHSPTLFGCIAHSFGRAAGTLASGGLTRHLKTRGSLGKP